MRLVPVFLFGGFLLVGCDDSTTDPLTTPSAATQLVVVSGQGQSQLAGYPLDGAIVLEARDATGRPVAGEVVEISGLAPSAEVFTDTNITNATGHFTLRWRLASRLGDQELQARLSARPEVPLTRISATATGSPVRAVTGDELLLCALYPDGRLGCWRPQIEPPLAPPTVTMLTTPVVLQNLVVLSTFTQGGVAAGCGTAQSGRVWCFDFTLPTLGTTNWREIGGSYAAITELRGALTGTFTPFVGTYCGIDTAGDLWCWGRTNASLVVTPDPSGATETAQRVLLPNPVTTFTIDVRHGCAAEADGTTWCWGDGASGELGRPPEDSPGPIPQPIASDLRFAALLASDDNAPGTCGITFAAALYCWGWGDPNTMRQALAPETPLWIPRLTRAGVTSMGVFPFATFIRRSGGNAEWWGSFPTSEVIANDVRDTRWPVPLESFDVGSPNDFICGVGSGSSGTLCLRSKALFNDTRPGSSPSNLIGFGVPGP